MTGIISKEPMEVDGPAPVLDPVCRRELLSTPPLSQTAADLYALDPARTSLKEIATRVSADPALSSAVLRMVNSPLFPFRQPVTSILQAIALIGFNGLRSLTLTAEFRSLVRPTSGFPALTRCWRHAVATALSSRTLAERQGLDGAAAYACGLLHDFGRFAMLTCWPEEYGNLLDTGSSELEPAHEREAFGLAHTDAGALLLQQWRLPEAFVEVAGWHHSVQTSSLSRMTQIVMDGCRTAAVLGFTSASLVPDPCGCLESLQPDADALSLAIADAINQLELF